MKTWETTRRKPWGRRASRVLETGLFSLAHEHILCLNLTPFHFQAMLMMKGLMERSLHHETALGRVREKVKLEKEELFELRNWKVVTEQKL